jgi:SAM-dependent methyltransferase
MAGEPREVLQREEGRRLFGLDPSVYEAGRPQYPAVLYRALEERCGLADGARVLEVGPGTGLVTRRLLGAGASVVAVEPNANLAAHLRGAFAGDEERLLVLEDIFEAAELSEDAFDLAVAATSFHWVDQERGLAKVARALRPGGSVALWWTLYQDPTQLDDFSRAAERVLGPRTWSSFDEPGRPPFQLDAEHRLRDLQRWGGFEDVGAEIFKTPRVLDAREVRALYASVALVLRRSPAEQVAVLDALEGIVRDRFGGSVERLFVTALYTGRRPEVAVTRGGDA